METQKKLLLWLVIFYASAAAMESDGSAPMEIDYKQMRSSINAKALKQFMTMNDSKDLQIKLGTEVIESSGLKDIFAYAADTSEQQFKINKFQKMDEIIGFSSGQFDYMPAIDHAGNQIAIPINDRVHIADLSDQRSQHVISFNAKFANIEHIDWSSDDRYVAIHCTEQGLIVYDRISQQKIVPCVQNQAFCWHATIAHHLFVMNFDTCQIDIVDININKKVASFDIPVLASYFFSSSYAMSCSPDGNYLAVRFGTEFGILNMHTKDFFTVDRHAYLMQWSSDGAYLVYSTQCNIDTPYMGIFSIKDMEIVVKGIVHRKLVSLMWINDNRALMGIVEDSKNTFHRIFINPSGRKLPMSDYIPLKYGGFLFEKRMHIFDMPPKNAIFDGRFIIAINPNCISVFDYGKIFAMQQYLRSAIPLSQALFLIALYKSACKNEKLCIDSPEMQQAFDHLPECLKINLKKWVTEDKQSSDSCIIS